MGMYTERCKPAGAVMRNSGSNIYTKGMLANSHAGRLRAWWLHESVVCTATADRHLRGCRQTLYATGLGESRMNGRVYFV